MGRRRRRWEDVVDEDAREILKVRSWRRMAADRGEWGGGIEGGQGPTRAVVP